MLAMADLTVKKNDGTTNITYTALKGNSGDKSTAMWRSETASPLVAGRPVLTLSPKGSVNGKFRLTDVALSYPETYVNSTTGLTAVRDVELLRATVTISTELADTTRDEAISQFLNLMVAIKPALQQGYGFN